MDQTEAFIQDELQGGDKTGGDLFAEVIIPLAVPQTYTWIIPPQLQPGVQPGSRVEVGLRNKKYAGIVKTVHPNKPAAFAPKPILNVLDAEPVVHARQLQLWEWISGYYMCSEGEVMNAALPTNLKLSSESVLIWNEERSVDFSDLGDEEYVVAEALELKKELRISEVQQLLDASHVYPVIKKLIDKKVCFLWEELKERYRPRLETYITLSAAYRAEEKLEELLNKWSRAPKQLELLLAYLHLVKQEGQVTQTDLLKKAGASTAQLNGLIEKNILVAEKRSTDRIQAAPPTISIDFKLSDAQKTALGEINAVFREKKTCLLHGVTASGKTHLYIKLIQQCIEEGRQALYMLPEIALTAQIIRRLQKHFEGYIGIYHSRFNANERVEIWNKVKNGEIKVILGARSALLLPFREIGLIIVDEEHDPSYKQQDPAPRYHARDTAVYYASLYNAHVLLGSATPSLETYFNCEHHKYGLVKLDERYGESRMPVIELIDLKTVAARFKGKVMLSPQLKAAVESSLQQKKQVILFQNRRGYTPYVICTVCGWIPQCQNCDVTLTYHKSKNKLACHYCGTTYPVINTCPACGSHKFMQKNFGTEKVEEIITEEFPSARVARMDYDSIRGKHAHDTLIKSFEQQKVDILVGTQMVVKGLDFEHVNLVGILDADGLLNFTDFRVNERAFQLMEQVSGRAGRKDSAGKVMIQVTNTAHPVLNFVRRHDYRAFYDFETANRRDFFYPPFSRLIHITFRHKLNHLAEEAANLMVFGLKAEYGNYITGPAEPVVHRIRNLYRWELLLKLPKDGAIIQSCKTAISQQVTIIQSNKRYGSVDIIIDVDPV